MAEKNDLSKNLLTTFQENPERGFQRIVQTYQERVYWQIRRYTKNHQDTEDVMQNVFIKVWNALPDFRGDANLYTWIYRIAFNETHTFLAKANKRKTTDLDPPLFENEMKVSGKDFSPEEVEHVLKEAMKTLPEKQAIVFNLRYFDELKFQEISELIGTSVGGLKASYHHAVKKIEGFIAQF